MKQKDKTADAIQWATTWALATIIAVLLFAILVTAGQKGLLGPDAQPCDTPHSCPAAPSDIPYGFDR